MTWRQEKTKDGYDLVWDSPQTGIAPSALLGTANLQNVNIATEMGDVLASYARTVQFTSSTQASITNGTLTASIPNGVELLASSASLKAGFWINITSSTIVRTDLAIEYMVVAGGGGGGGLSAINSQAGAGGGAGGLLSGTASVAVTTYAVTVGAGGTAGTTAGSQGGDGASSIIATIATATGGGGGGGNVTLNGRTGGSGGGGGSDGSGAGGTGGTGTAGQGLAGGIGQDDAGGGGGGFTQIGFAGNGDTAGNGGDGGSIDISGTVASYSGGGGGGCDDGGTFGVGGAGGGGNGGINSNGFAGTANSGGGGGGAGSSTGAGLAYTGGVGGSGIVIIRYPTGMMTATGGTITTSGDYTVHTFTANGNFQVTSATLSGRYYVSFQDGTNRVKISQYYDPLAENAVVHGTTGTATFSTVSPLSIASPTAKASEKYLDMNSVEYRYYILDSNSYVWVYDTGAVEAAIAAGGTLGWALIDATSYASEPFFGMNVLNGWLHVFSHRAPYVKQTSNLGMTFAAMTGASMMNIDNSSAPIPHYAYVGHQGKMFYTDNNYIGEIFPTTSLATGNANVQSFSEWTLETSTSIDVEVIINGSSPIAGTGVGGRMPVVFFPEQGGALPTLISAEVVYWLQPSTILDGTYSVFSASSGGTEIPVTGSIGRQYFNTYYPVGAQSGTTGSEPLVTFSNQRVNLPSFETAQCMVEIGNTLLIGGRTNTIYPWNQIDATPSDLIYLPESDIRTMINVNNMAYAFAGNKGNIYISNNSVASLVANVPDYCAGVPGTPLTYIEPTFTWGDSMFLRGRVYFSILDQTSIKVGNCGGIWSFIPTQNVAAGQDTGISMRLENQNSYLDYDGLCTVLLPNEEQAGTSPQYWTGWQDSYSTGTSAFGIDYTGTVPVITSIVETDLLPTGSLLNKETFQQLEYKVSTPLQSGDSVQLFWRTNSTSAWTSGGTVNEETSNRVAGYFVANFEKTQWVQVRAVMTTGGTTSSSFNRLNQIRIR